MTNIPPFLHCMPHIVLENISGHLGVFDIQNLRSVCKPLRTFVDNIPHNVNVNEFYILIGFNRINVDFWICERHVATEYKQNRITCSVKHTRKNDARYVRFKGVNYEELFLKHLELIFINHIVSVTKFSVTFEHVESMHPITEKLSQLLARGRNKMKVEDMNLYVTNLDEIHAVLPHIHSIGVKSVLVGRSRENQVIVLSKEVMDRLGNLPEWKQPQRATFFGNPKVRLLSSNVMRRVFRHVNGSNYVHPHVNTVHLKDLLFIKEMMTQENGTLQECQITYHEFPEEQQFRTILGPENRKFRNGYEWHVKISDEHETLLITLSDRAHQINFYRRSDIPGYFLFL